MNTFMSQCMARSVYILDAFAESFLSSFRPFSLPFVFVFICFIFSLFIKVK